MNEAGWSAPCDVSIILVVYKTPDFLRRCLDSIASSRIALSWEVLVIDNAPREGDCRSVAEGRPGVRYFANPRNIGFGRACNQAMRLASGKVYLILNPDIEVLPGSVEALYELLRREPDAGIAAPRLHYEDGRLQESCRTFYTLPVFLLRRTFLGKLFPNARIIREHLMSDWNHAETRNVDWCLGGGLMARREAVDDVGMMDERFFMYFEDVDWCYRMHQRGWRVLYHPDARMIHHYQRASAGWKPSRGLIIHLGSTLRYYEKWSFLLYWLKLRSRRLRQGALLASDLLMVALAFVLAYWIRGLAAGFLTKPMFGFSPYVRFLAFTLCLSLASFLALGLYRERMRASVIEVGIPVTRALWWTSILMMAATFLFSVRTYSRVVVVLFFPLAVLLVTCGRVLILRAVDSVRRRDLNLRRIGLLGPPEALSELAERFERYGRFGMEPVPLAQPAAWGEAGDPAEWVRRLQSERVQEVVLFEDWAGEVGGVLLALRERGIPVRVIPALRGVLPAGGAWSNFMGWPSLQVGETRHGGLRSSGRRLGDLFASLLFGILWLPPFLLIALARSVRGRPLTERVALRGREGQSFTVRRLAGAQDASGFWRSILEWYPALPSVASGEMSLVGIHPFAEDAWGQLDPDYRARPPAAPAGLVGPWTGQRIEAEVLARWNRSYPEQWSAAEDFRIFWKAVLGLKDGTGGKP